MSSTGILAREHWLTLPDPQRLGPGKWLHSVLILQTSSSDPQVTSFWQEGKSGDQSGRFVLTDQLWNWPPLLLITFHLPKLGHMAQSLQARLGNAAWLVEGGRQHRRMSHQCPGRKEGGHFSAKSTSTILCSVSTHGPAAISTLDVHP